MTFDGGAAATVGRAEVVQGRMRRAGRWYPATMIAFGLLTVALVACVPVVRDTARGVLFILVSLLWAGAVAWQKYRNQVRPVSNRHMRMWAAAWVVLYLSAVFWIGPHFLAHRAQWWALMGLVVASPAWFEAARAWRQVYA